MPLDPVTLTEQPTDKPTDDILSQINDDDLSKHILDRLKADLQDREEFGWDYMRQYDELAYAGYKSKATEPWTNASNFAVPLTPTLLDTAHANTIGSIYSDDEKVVDVDGVGLEDMRSAKNLASTLNFQVLNDIENAEDTLDKTIHVAFKHGNAAIKVLQQDKIVWSRVDIWNLFFPINARGAQPSETDHIFELIQLTENEKIERETLKDDSGNLVYDGIKDLQKGAKIFAATQIDSIIQKKDVTSGTSLGRRFSSDFYYILECYITYWHKPKEGDPKKLELVVWISPNGGKIHRKRLNPHFDDLRQQYVRPYSVKWIPYPREDRLYGDSLPWLIKQTQEELDYAHNQVMNAAEELIKPPKFYDPSSGFDPETTEQTPNGWYPVPSPQQNVYIPVLNFNPIFERQFERYWEYAQRRTGLTELFQGRTPDREQTLGEAKIRTNKTEIRFKTIYKRIERGFRELIELTYFYDRKFLPKDYIVKVLGTTEYKTVDEIFPKGMTGKFNFYFSSAPISEKNEIRDTARMFYEFAMTNTLVAQDPGNQWHLLNFLAGSMDIRNLQQIIKKPKEADILSAEEAIQRIYSGQYDLQPHPLIDTADYDLKINQFMRTEAFVESSPEVKQAIMLLMRRVKNIRIGQSMGALDPRIIEAQVMAQAQQVQPMGSQPQEPV